LLPLRRADGAAAPLIWGALFAWIELAGGLYLGPLDGFARAEAMVFLVCRPWPLVLAALCAGHWTGRRRAFLYAIIIGVAAASETILLLQLGAIDPWPEMLRGIAAGAVIALVADIVVQALRRWRAFLGSLIAFALLGGLIWLASGTRPYEAMVLGPTSPRVVAGPKPPLLLMTSLPIVWGVGGAFDPDSRPAESYRALEREFEVTPIDSIEPATLRAHRLMLLAQPRRLAPEELVAVDGWVRRGGRILILTDPVLVAARGFSVADMNRPPETGLLGPLLDHWGLRVEPGNRFQDLHYFPAGGGQRRLLVAQPGKLAIAGNSCRIAGRSFLARCRIGRGEAIIVADADILTDATWAPSGPPRGHERHLRLADNPLIIADWLDGLAGLSRERSDRPVAWVLPWYSKLRALLHALLPGIAGIAVGVFLLGWGGWRRRRSRPEGAGS
jgi:hypothetical protein